MSFICDFWPEVVQLSDEEYVLLIKTNVFFFIRKLCSLSLTHLGDHSVSLGKIKVYNGLANGATIGYIKRKE